MADPITMMAAVTLGTTAAGAVTGAIGSSYEGKAKSQMYQYQMGVSEVNKQIQQENAAYARKVGEVQAQKAGLMTRASMGRIRAIKGASGLDLESGSTQDVLRSESEIGQQNQAIIRSNAARQAYGFETAAVSQEAQKGLYGMASSNALAAGELGAWSSLIGGASSVASKWMQYGPVFGKGATPGADWGSGAP